MIKTRLAPILTYIFCESSPRRMTTEVHAKSLLALSLCWMWIYPVATHLSCVFLLLIAGEGRSTDGIQRVSKDALTNAEESEGTASRAGS